MEVRLIDSSLADVKAKLKRFANYIQEKYKRKPEKCKVKIIFKRGDITMSNEEWAKDTVKDRFKKLTLDEAISSNALSEKNLNMGMLGYGNAKGGLQELVKWVKHNINPQKLKGENRDLNIKIESVKTDDQGKSVTVILRVPEKGAESSKDLENVQLEKLGYVGLKKWTEEQLNNIKDSKEELDVVLYKILTDEASLKDTVGKVTTDEN